MNTTTLTTSITIPKMDLSLLKDLAKKFGWTINNTTSYRPEPADIIEETTIVSEPLFGPTSLKEAISRVQDAEKEYTLNGSGTTLQEFTAELKDEQLW